MQRMAIEILCQELVRIGILIGDQEELIELGVPTAFYYHGKNKTNVYTLIRWHFD